MIAVSKDMAKKQSMMPSRDYLDMMRRDSERDLDSLFAPSSGDRVHKKSKSHRIKDPYNRFTAEELAMDSDDDVSNSFENDSENIFATSESFIRQTSNHKSAGSGMPFKKEIIQITPALGGSTTNFMTDKKDDPDSFKKIDADSASSKTNENEPVKKPSALSAIMATMPARNVLAPMGGDEFHEWAMFPGREHSGGGLGGYGHPDDFGSDDRRVSRGSRESGGSRGSGRGGGVDTNEMPGRGGRYAGRHAAIRPGNSAEFFDSDDSDDERLAQSHARLGGDRGGRGDDNLVKRRSLRAGGGGLAAPSAGGAIFQAFFEEHLSIPAIPVTIPNINVSTVNDFIELAINALGEKYPERTLKGNPSAVMGHYMVCEMDDGDIDKDVRYKGHLKMREVDVKTLILTLTPKGLANTGGGTTNASGLSSPPHHMLGLSGNSSLSASDRSRGHTIERINSSHGGLSFVKISIPGPATQSIVLKFEQDSQSILVRDLFYMLNKKKGTAMFHPHYFEIFYQGDESKESPISNGMKVLDLKIPRNLTILPKKIGVGDRNRDDAFKYDLVRMANEYKEWRAFKLRNGKRKGRILGVDRYRITKQAIGDKDKSVGDGGDDDDLISRKGTVTSKGLGFISAMTSKISKPQHVPIDISTVVSAKIVSGNAKQCKVTYTHPRGGLCTHIYEMKSQSECREFSDKVTFLVTLTRLRP